MIPLAIPNLSGKEGHYLQECIASGYVSSVGPFVQRLEQMIAVSTKAGSAVVTSSGTTALHLALVAVGVRPGDLVILPSFTFIASANAISHTGATPWLFDVTAHGWALDPDLMAQRLEVETRRGPDGFPIHIATGRRVSAIMPVYTLGLPADIDPIANLAKAYHLPVVSDAAAALGATYKGRAIGELPVTLSALSFNGNKTITTGSGGAIIGSNPALMKLASHLCSTARIGTDYTHDAVGYNYRMCNLEAAVGCAQGERLIEFLDAKKRIHARYQTELSQLKGLSFFPAPEYAEGTHWLSGIVLDDNRSAQALIARLNEKNISAKSFWKPMHLQRPYSTAPCTTMAVAEDIWDRVVTLPCSTHLSHSDQTHVIETVHAFAVRQ